jgi:hypothetical protein
MVIVVGVNVKPVLEVASVVGTAVREPDPLLVMGVSGEVPVGPELDVMFPDMALLDREGIVVTVELDELLRVALAEGSKDFEVKFAVMALLDRESVVITVPLIDLVDFAEGSPMVALREMEMAVPVPILPVPVALTPLADTPEPVGSGKDGNE